jgi:hypothetical protein
MNTKQKLANAKQKIKTYAPEIITVTAVVTTIALVAKSLHSASKAVLDVEFVPFPVIDGEEKEKLFGRDDTILQHVEDNFYFLSVVPKTED